MRTLLTFTMVFIGLIVKAQFLCGDDLTVNHVAGTVAPVSKGVTYRTVFVSDLCWITKNLGSDRQALAFSDSTEASAGWYWQFNRKQGYKHTGLTRTPGSEWVTRIQEVLDWESANDPCAIELGEGWRVPTYTEWDKTIEDNNWGNGSVMFSSVLKIHAAGKLSSSDGTLEDRGGVVPKGRYWSGTNIPFFEGLAGFYISVLSNGVSPSFTDKSSGFSVRCVGDYNEGGGCTLPPSSPVTASHTVSTTQIIWDWYEAESATGYKFNTVNSYATASDLGNVTTRTETGLSCNTAYTRYVWAYNDCGESSPLTLTSTTLGLSQAAPTEGTHTAEVNQILWDWNTVSGATGYKWNTVNTYGSATNVGTATFKIESELEAETEYVRYVWAYNACGYSTSITLTESTLPEPPPWVCGDSIEVIHSAGSVAPVTKTVVYHTTDSVAGSSACWITQNLGATRQATAISDVTEASGGWYWQFNRKQGYKHTGTVRTPSSTWRQINESSDWVSGNDPCTIELGSGWRIPTRTEWLGVDASGRWVNKYLPWVSDIKLHPAGRLYYTTGALGYRGSYGYYWSSTSVSNSYGYVLSINSSVSKVDTYVKSYGYSVRCLKP